MSAAAPVKSESREARKSLIEAIDREATARGGEDGSCFAEFARAFLAGAEGRPLQTHGTAGLVSAASDGFELARQRRGDERHVRVRLPADLPGRSVIEVLQPDRPFLVDTLRLFLRRHRLQEQMLLHPTIRIRRDAAGRLCSVGDEEGVLESLIYVEVYPRVDEVRARDLESELAQIMGWVANVTDDHRRMIRFVREIGANVEFARDHIEGGEERVAKISRFLDWLVEHHFVFMGARRYEIRGLGDEMEIVLRPEAGLGMWRSDGESRFREPRRGAEIPPVLRYSLADPRLVQVSKGWTESRIHRSGRIDRILVKEHDEQGRLSGFSILSGLFTFAALRMPSSQVPLLAERLEQILEAEGAEPGSHRYKALVAAFDSAPMEFLFGAEVAENAALIREIVDAEGAEEPRVVLHTDAGGRSYYAAVLLPRERYGEVLRGEVRKLFEADPRTGHIDDRVSFLEEGTALLHFFCTLREGEPPDAAALEARVRQLATRWQDQLTDALIADHGSAIGGELAARYAEAFPEALRVATHPVDAVRDVRALEALHAEQRPQMALFIDDRMSGVEFTMLRVYLGSEWLLSDLLPLVDHFGIRVIDARQTPVTTQDRGQAFVHALRIVSMGETQAELDEVAPRLEAALRAALLRVVPDDALNALVLVAGLDWREVDLIRAYLEYFNQIQTTLTRAFVRDVLLHNPQAVRLLVELHAARLRPGPEDEERAAREAGIRERFEGYRDRIASLNEDRALGSVLELIGATLRTNFYAEPAGVHRIAIKLDPSAVSSLTPPHPYREIFVHGSGVDGIHIRGGPVARGGIRWSDRLDDFRAEVLGLMRTQQLKNGLIVPVGAKGGFVLREADLPQAEARQKADEAYQVFIAGLLDVTDDIDAEGVVVPPAGVFRRDDDDPYLVVAADKGTAHLSDTANALALERGFWLGDAFASGGSVGYDHKKYAITARGAWECVKHHFAELGLDAERDAYSVAGIGDMSGDVFGNGLLLMRQARLVAAFDHRHVFIDPDPDPERAWSERRRLFDLPRSSWADYDPACLSKGGGVWPRSAKRIELSPEACERLGLETPIVTGPELVRAVLRAPVDLLWNGGIGTYVKASAETHASVGDRANESVRIDADELRARVLGEGGNLGLTQASRVEAARRGVRLDTDAIHNSAGVDLSDQEVNYKILLAQPLRVGELSAGDRAAQLIEVAEEACESVLAHNRAQALSISLDERRSARDLESFRWAISTLCESQAVSAKDLELPDEATLQARRAAGEGLARPELAVLLGLAKLHARQAIARDPFVDRPSLTPLFEAAFPAALKRRFPEALAGHRLRREITALAVTNRIVDVGGVTAITTMTAKRGLPVATAAAALLAADEILEGPRLREALMALRGRAELDEIDDALLSIGTAVQDVARYLIAEDLDPVEPARTRAWSEALFGLAEQVESFLSREEADRFGARKRSLVQKGIPENLASLIAGAPLADRGLNIVRLVERTGQPILAVSRAYARLGDASGINWVFQNLPRAAGDDAWDRLVLMDLRTEVLSLQRVLAEQALRQNGGHGGHDEHGMDPATPGDPEAAVEAFLAAHEESLRRVHALLPEAQTTPSASALTVVVQALARLRPSD